MMTTILLCVLLLLGIVWLTLGIAYSYERWRSLSRQRIGQRQDPLQREEEAHELVIRSKGLTTRVIPPFPVSSVGEESKLNAPTFAEHDWLITEGESNPYPVVNAVITLSSLYTSEVTNRSSSNSIYCLKSVGLDIIIFSSSPLLRLVLPICSVIYLVNIVFASSDKASIFGKSLATSFRFRTPISRCPEIKMSVLLEIKVLTSSFVASR